jgi:DNA polymerase-3 subunit chi
MAEVSFYVLPTSSAHERLNFACKLIEKIYRSGESCYALIGSEEQAIELDKQLWAFRAGSFVPHQIYNGLLPELSQTVLIGGNDIPESRQAIILNLSESMPVLTDKTQRLLEILDNSEACKQAGRERYKHYQQQRFKIETHKMAAG